MSEEVRVRIICNVERPSLRMPNIKSDFNTSFALSVFRSCFIRKALQREGVVARNVDEAASPPTVTYSLTEKGVELAEIIAQIEELEVRYS